MKPKEIEQIKGLNKTLAQTKNFNLRTELLLNLINQTRKETYWEIYRDFKKIWSCLKFEKRSAKVIGYTFVKGDIDDFKNKLKNKFKGVE